MIPYSISLRDKNVNCETFTVRQTKKMDQSNVKQEQNQGEFVKIENGNDEYPRFMMRPKVENVVTEKGYSV